MKNPLPKYTLVLTLYFILSYKAYSQSGFNINGIVKNSTTGEGLQNAEIKIIDADYKIVSNKNGLFSLKNINSNRIRLSVSIDNYEEIETDLIVLDKFSNNYIVIQLKKKPNELKALEVSANKYDESKPKNSLSYVSTRSFSADDTEHIPASVNDPGRMALSFPGVQVGRDENENKIIIRGNSPQGVLWRVEGIDVPNPNHFARPGAAGGGLSIFSAQLLAKSDFSIGGMSAEYGNAIAGAFDIKFREGNAQKKQHFVRAGILGIDLSTEGPIKEGRSSYLINYRYSTLGLMNQIKVYLVGERALNTFQDLSFNLVFHSKSQKQVTKLFGVGGKSEESFFPVENSKERRIDFPEDREDKVRASSTGVLGISHQYKINEGSNFKITIAGIGSGIVRRFDTLNTENVRFRYNTEDYIDKRITTTAVYENRINNKIYFKTGLFGNFISYDFLRETYPRGNYSNSELNVLKNVFFEGKENTQTLQSYVTTESKLSNKIKIQAGIHYLHLFLNNKKSFEPRLSLNYQINRGKSISLAYGLYSQLLPLTTYFVVKSNANKQYQYINPNVNFPQSHHFIGRYQYVSKNNWKTATEIYYQALRRIQISPSGGNFWMLNFSDGFADGPTIDDGTGFNYGIDFLIEKFFANKFYFLGTGSLFEAKFKTLEKATFNSSFNDNFGISITSGREFKTNRTIWQGGFRAMYNGGFRYSPLDSKASKEYGFYMPVVSDFNTLQAPNYYRIDGRIAAKFKIKGKATTVSLDIQNVTANNNYSRVRYYPSTNELKLERKGVGLVPIFSFGMGL